MYKILALFTCFNRKEKTLKCIESLKHNENIVIDYIVVDDNSSDGTQNELSKFDNINLINSGGNSYYSGGMRIAIMEAKKMDLSCYDYIMLMNDDVVFYQNSISKLVLELDGKESIIIGSTCDNNGNLSYGGVVKTSKIKPSFKMVMSTSVSTEYCDTFCANCVLIPKKIFIKAPNIDKEYIHAMGDFDYGFEISKMGYKIIASSFFVGICNDNEIEGTYNDKSLSIKERFKLKESVKGLPRKQWFYYLKKNHGIICAILYSIIPYVKILFNR